MAEMTSFVDHMTSVVLCDSAGLKCGSSIAFFTNTSVLFTDTPSALLPEHPPSITSHSTPRPTVRSTRGVRPQCVSSLVSNRSHQASISATPRPYLTPPPRCCVSVRSSAHKPDCDSHGGRGGTNMLKVQ